MKKISTSIYALLLSLFTLTATNQLQAQISGVKTVGATGDYQNLTSAFADITAQTLNGNIVLQLASDYPDVGNPEIFPIVAPTSVAIGSFTVNVYPTATGLTISGSSATGIINLSNTKNITIDGRVNATGTTTDLVIANSDITTGYVVQFANIATANTLKYCSIRGGEVSATSGVVVFGTAASLGNSNNTISNCSIRDAGNGLPTNGIYAVGSATFPNSNNTIDNCNIFNFFNAAAASQGINIGAGNTAWTITNNSLYQQSVRTSTASATATCTGILLNTLGSLWTANTTYSLNQRVYFGLNIYTITVAGTSGTTAPSHITGSVAANGGTATLTYTGATANSPAGFIITDNAIGGNNVGAGGTWVQTGGTSRIHAMNISAGSSTANSIQNNLIRNFSLTTTVNTNPVFAGIVVQTGSFNIGTVAGNTIGASTGTGSISITMSGSAATVNTALAAYGIWMTATVSASTYNVSNNQIGSFTLDATSVNHALGFEGIIATSGSATAINITNNTIGSTVTANSINSPTLSVTGAQLLRGIDIQSTITGGNINIALNSNIVANINQNGTTTGSNNRGIVYFGAAAAGTVTINNNQVYNISGAGSLPPSVSTQGAVAGIVNFGTGTNLNTILGNDVHSIYGTNTGALHYNVIGIVASNVVASNILKNKIYDIRNASTMTTPTTPPVVAGILYGASGAPYVMANNMITLGNGQTNNVLICGIVSAGNSGGGVQMYYNSIRIMGTATTGAYPSFGFLRTNAFSGSFGANAGGTAVTLRNNLIDNIRTGGTGKHYAIGNISASGLSGFGKTASNYNIFNAPNTSQLAVSGTGPAGTDYSFAGFKALTGGDAASITGAAVTFLDPANGDLHINMGTTPNQVESSGTSVAGFTTDYDNQTRPGPTAVNGAGMAPDIGADEFDGVYLDLLSPVINYSALSNSSLTTTRTVNGFATITDFISGVNTIAGTKPRLYFKRSGDANAYNDNTPATDGWKFVEASNGSSPFSFTIDYTLLNGGTNVAIGNVIQYFVTAQDHASTPNVGINSGTFAIAPTSVALTSAAFPIGGIINSYLIATAYVGSINVGTGEAITSLTNPNGLFDKMNYGALTGSLTVNITSDLTAESGTIGLNQLVEEGIGGYSMTIKPNGAARTISGTPSGPSLLKLSGADRVTIDGSLSYGTDRSLSIINYSPDYLNRTISGNCVIHVSSPTTTNGATYNTIKNCIIRGLSNLGTEYVIAQGGSDAGGDLGSGALSPNSNNTYQNNEISAGNFGIFLNGSSTNPDQNTIVTGNSIGSSVTARQLYYAGVWSQGEVGMQITNNSISGIAGSLTGSNAISGIFINSVSTNSVITGNNITNIANTSTTGGATGIRLGAFSTSTNVLVANNTISNISCPGSAAVPTETNNSSGIIVTSAQQANTYKIYYNSINLTTNQTIGISAAFVTTTGVTLSGAIDFRNNIIANSQTTNTRYAVYVASGSNAIFSTINNNLYYTAPGGTLGYLTSARSTLAAWQSATGQDANSINADPMFNSPVVLSPLAGSPVLGAGVPVADITTDYAGVVRNSTNPSIGAYELSAAPCSTHLDTSASICPSQLPYTWNGLIFTTSGSQTKTGLTNAAGCDSSATLNLTVSQITSSTDSISICPSQLPYSWNGLTFASAGSQTKTGLTNAAGCDSTATLNLSVLESTSSTTDLAVCSLLLPYTWNGFIFTGAGSQTKTGLVNAAGCDSSATFNLSVLEETGSATDTTVCPTALPFVWNGLTFTQEGAQTKTGLTNAAGCDSSATLNVIVNPVSSSSSDTLICPSQLPFSWNGLTFTGSGSQTKTGLTAVSGCDSSATLNLIVKQVTTSTTDTSICSSSLPLSWNGFVYSTAGSQTKTGLVNAEGCDSSATFTVTVRYTTSSTTNVSICQSELPYLWNGQSLTIGGTYTTTLTNIADCDSVATLVLIVKSLPVVSFNLLAPIYNRSAATVTLKGSPVGGTFSGPGVTGTSFSPAAAGVGGPYTIVYSYTNPSTTCSNVASQQTSVASCSVSGTPAAITTVGGAATICPGDTKSYSIAAVTNATHYTWTAPAGGVITGGQGTTQVTINYTSAFTASAILSVVSNNACGFSGTRSLAITRNTPLTPSLITGSTFGVCRTNGIPYSVTNVAGMTYNWVFNTVNAIVSTGQGTSSILANFNTGYLTGIVSVTASNGCGTSAARSATIKATPATPVAITGASSVCANQANVPYSIATLPGAASYYWLSPTGSKLSDGVTTSTTNTLATTNTAVTVRFATTGGNISVRGNNACGNGSYKTLPVSIACFAKEAKEYTLTGEKKTFNVSLSPNPSPTEFRLTAHGGTTQNVQIRVLDVNGKNVYQAKGQAEQTFRFGNSFANGLYMIEVRQGEEVKTVKAVKGK